MRKTKNKAIISKPANGKIITAPTKKKPIPNVMQSNPSKPKKIILFVTVDEFFGFMVRSNLSPSLEELIMKMS